MKRTCRAAGPPACAVAPCAGAWIEAPVKGEVVMNVRRRPLRGAWIEAWSLSAQMMMNQYELHMRLECDCRRP